MRPLLDALDPALLRGDDRTFCHLWANGHVTPLTYHDLVRGSVRYAAAYRAAAVAPGEVVLIALRHSPDLLFAFFGALIAGTVPSLMPPPASRHETSRYWTTHRRLLEQLEGAAVLTSRDIAGSAHRHLEGLFTPLLLSEDVRTDRALDNACRTLRHANDEALIQRRTGTDGLTEHVVWTFSAIDDAMAAHVRAIGDPARECVVSWFPFFDAASLIACVLLPFASQMPLVLLDPGEQSANPRLLVEAVALHGGTLSWMPERQTLEHVAPDTVAPIGEAALPPQTLSA